MAPNGSLSINVRRGTFFDHERGIGGGVEFTDPRNLEQTRSTICAASAASSLGQEMARLMIFPMMEVAVPSKT
jgi:hypothetical protein